MSSISLPRVLTQRKGGGGGGIGPVEMEREHFEKTQTTSISKAINNLEIPIKEKHVRSAIIGTYHVKGASVFWSVVGNLPIQGDRIVCWKFCHTLHKLLREGHPLVVPDSQPYKSKLRELGRYWGHLRDAFGKLNSHYCVLLATKLDFHARNPKIPGNMQLTEEQLESIGEMDINNFFQMSVEMFDYLEEILNLQAAVFGSLETGRANSMTSSGQCRLSPLIPCILDSSHLYDYLVKLLFKLHSTLPPDVLAGHRERFYKQYKVLREFYKSANNLQYFKNLIQIHLLPNDPPNFLRMTDLSGHMKPVVVLPQQPDSVDSDSIDMSLVDSSSSNLIDVDPSNGSPSPELASEKDHIIERLMLEIEELKMEIQRIKSESRQLLDDKLRTIMELESRLAELQRLLLSKHQEVEQLKTKEMELAGNEEAAVKLVEAEKKAKASEEKFTKMKDVYAKLRDEHVTLIRTKADLDRQLTAVKQSSQDSEKGKSELEEKLLRICSEKQDIENEMITLVDSNSAQVKSLNEAHNELERVILDLEQQLAEIVAEKEALELDKLMTVKSSSEEISLLLNVKAELQRRNLELEANFQNVVFVRDGLQLRLDLVIAKTAQEVDIVWKKNMHLADKVMDLEEIISTLNSEKENLQKVLDDFKSRVERLEEEMQHSKNDFTETEKRLLQESKDRQQSLLVCCVEEAENVVKSVLIEIDNPSSGSLTCTPEYLLSLTEPLNVTVNRLKENNDKYEDDNRDIECLLQSISGFAHYLCQFIIHGKATANATPDIERGDQLVNACRASGVDTLKLFFNLKTKGNVPESINKVHADIDEVRNLVDGLIANAAANVEDQIGDMVEKELYDMDCVIEEAASRIAAILNKSREADTGTKLEVNEKILDACTALMQAIKVLVKRSKDLQIEIVAQGKGKSSVKEFYKRNHRWTEGLLSAAKAVGFGAKFLVDAADRVVSGEAKFEELMVASQEIAASTAQLVVASKVKADANSQNMRNLSLASKDVSHSTGNVVATVKSCAQMMEDSDVMDFSKLSLHQAKRLEMESQVKVLELESNLVKERQKLSALRKRHYMLAGPGEGWEEEDITK